MKTAVALVLFNRPDKTERVFSAIAQARPPRLLLIADGPRPGNRSDVELCEAARQVVEKVDWDCEVKRNYSDVNLGCGERPASGIDWVFSHEDRAILLEDDGLPHPSFFEFCDELLERYAEDERICQISGHTLQLGHQRGPYSYYFSRHNYCLGGFATWRRAWRQFDFRMTRWPELKEIGLLENLLPNERARGYWQQLFDKAWRAGDAADFWDYQWTFACWANNGLTVMPNGTLLTNIGFGPDATHTRSESSLRANRDYEPVEFPLRHPPYVAPHAEADKFFVEMALPKPRARASLKSRIKRRILDSLPTSLRESVARVRR